MQTSGRATRRTIPNVSGPMLRIAHLYADEMNIYGDRGNILTLQKRAEWRGGTGGGGAPRRGPPPHPPGNHPPLCGGGGGPGPERGFTPPPAPHAPATR